LSPRSAEFFTAFRKKSQRLSQRPEEELQVSYKLGIIPRDLIHLM